MRRLNVLPFYKLGASLGPLRLLEWLERDTAWEILFSARDLLRTLRTDRSLRLEIITSAISGLEIDIDEAYEKLSHDDRISEDQQARITKALEEFETIFEAQVPIEYTYLIEQLRGYSMPLLVDSAEQNFTPTLLASIGSEVIKDIREAGRCLAFELPTAAGIHMMRAFEKVFRRFYRASLGNEPGTSDIFRLIKNLQDDPRSDPKTLSIIDQIRHLHRNPLAHEVFLEMDEAVELFDIAKSAITAMARKL